MNIRHSVSCQNVLFSYQGSDSSEEILFCPLSDYRTIPQRDSVGNRNHTHPWSISEIELSGFSCISKTHSWIHGVWFSYKQNEILLVKLQTSAMSPSELSVNPPYNNQWREISSYVGLLLLKCSGCQCNIRWFVPEECLLLSADTTDIFRCPL